MLWSPSAPETFNGRFRSIPEIWDGRLVRVGGGDTRTGGDLTHTHGLTHAHVVVQSPNQIEGTVAPVGLDEVVAGAQHVHPIASSESTVVTTQPSRNVPRSRELYGLLASRNLSNAPRGVMVAYAGEDVPKGWAACDGTHGPLMADLYIRIRRSRVSQIPVGADSHEHVATHEHVWRADAPQRDADIGVAVDHASTGTAPPNSEAAPYKHVHVVTGIRWEGSTDPADALPPTVTLRFIISVNERANLPRRSIVGYTGRFIPLGWTRFDSFNGQAVIGRFIRGATAAKPAGSFFGSDSHRHRVPHTHQLTLDISAAKPVAVRKGSGTIVAAATHIHRLKVTDPDIVTNAGSSIPPFVDLKFIQKN